MTRWRGAFAGHSPRPPRDGTMEDGVSTKLRVTDLASEFGITSEEVVAMLRSLDVVVRSHITPLTDDQVARARKIGRAHV